MPNHYTGQPVNDFAMTVNELENILGIDLFARLNDKIEEEVEGQMDLANWR